MVDWRGRWIDDEEYGDVDEEEEGDKQMEDFDPVRLFSDLRQSFAHTWYDVNDYRMLLKMRMMKRKRRRRRKVVHGDIMSEVSSPSIRCGLPHRSTYHPRRVHPLLLDRYRRVKMTWL